MANDTFTVTLDIINKTATYVGTPAIKTTLDVTVVNIGDATPTDLELQVLIKDDLYAQIDAGDMSASGSDAIGTLDLNTTALITYFANLSDQAKRNFSLIIQDTGDSDLLCNFPMQILNNPYDAGATTPSTPGSAVTVSAATVIGEIAIWASIDGILDNSGLDVNQLADGLSTSDTAIPTAKLVKSVTDALTVSVVNTLKRTAGDFAASISSKGTPVLADRVLMEDSEDSFSKKHTTVGGIQSVGTTVPASNALPDTTNFNTNLSAADDTVQKALDTLDDLVTGGDVVGPASAVADKIATFNGATGKIIKDSTVAIADIGTNSAHVAGDGSDHADVAANTGLAHAEAHAVASHSDTTATGAELETLTDGSNADSLHVHAAVGGISAIAEKTADYTIVDGDDGTLLVLGRATVADRTFTLPTLSDNLGDTDRIKNVSDFLLTVIAESRGTDAAEAGTTSTVINATGHIFVAGQVLRMTSGDESGEERRIDSVGANDITIENALSGAPSPTETFEVFDGIEGESRKLLGFGEQLNFHGADLTTDEWVITNA